MKELVTDAVRLLGCDVQCVRVDELLSDDAIYAAALAELPAWRRQKAETFRFVADRRRSVAVWLLVRQMLAEKGIDADALTVEVNEFGKPAFDPALGVHFNLSHAGDRVMAVVSDSPVGCDVERIVPFDEAVARECLTDEELAWVKGTSSVLDRDRAFIRLWVRKEAYVKAIGRGLDIEPKSISVLSGKFPPGWCFRDLDFPDGYLGCIVVPLTDTGSKEDHGKVRRGEFVF